MIIVGLQLWEVEQEAAHEADREEPLAESEDSKVLKACGTRLLPMESSALVSAKTMLIQAAMFIA